MKEKRGTLIFTGFKKVEEEYKEMHMYILLVWTALKKIVNINRLRIFMHIREI